MAGGHVCHTIKDTRTQIMVNRICVDWTQYYNAAEPTGFKRKWEDTLGCEVMTKLLIKIEPCNEDGSPTFLWLLCSMVRWVPVIVCQTKTKRCTDSQHYVS